MLLALMWYYAGNGRGEKDMVDPAVQGSAALFSKYLQQLVMESLGKEKDLDGNIVHQGIAVYGNKGSTDQHAYVQQLRDGVPNFFVTFIEVRKDRHGGSRSKSSRASRAAITCRDFCAERARRFTKAGANRSRSAFRKWTRFTSAP